MTGRSDAEDPLDGLVIGVRHRAPPLETAAEISLVEVAAGRRMGFTFLGIHVGFLGLNVGAVDRAFDFADRRIRMERVRAIEAVLATQGVKVVPPGPLPRAAMSSRDLGLDAVDALRHFQYQEAHLGLGVLSSLITFLKDTDPDVVGNRVLVDRLLQSAFQGFAMTKLLIETYRPSFVVVENGRMACQKGITEAARLSGVSVRYFETSQSYERYYYSDHTPHDQGHARRDLRRSWSRGGDGRAAVARKFFAAGRLDGGFLRDGYLSGQQIGRTVAPTGKRRTVFFASSVDEFAAVDNGSVDTLFHSQYEAAVWLAEWTRARPDRELVIRMHPKVRVLAPAEKARWASLECDNVHWLAGDSPVDSYELAAGAYRVVTFHSSMGVEATYMGKVSILVGDAPYSGLDCVYEPKSRAEMEEVLMDDNALPKPQEHCLPYGFWHLTSDVAFRMWRPSSPRSGPFLGIELPPDITYAHFLHRRVLSTLLRAKNLLSSGPRLRSRS